MNADWRPRCSPEVAAVRSRMLRAAREFFAAHDVLEVETPALSPAAVSDINIESVRVELAADRRRPYFLHTSPEFAMKRLLAAGWPDIYQVCRVFRDGESGRRHQPEFSMIEWYRLDMAFDAMQAHTVDFIETLLPGERQPAVFVDYREAFSGALGFDPLTAADEALFERLPDGLAERLDHDRDACLDWLLATAVAPGFASDRLTVLAHYPASQAALSRLCPDDARVADRFEVFLGELELANGYAELTDAAEQRTRLQHDQLMRERRGLDIRPLDPQFLAALEAGLPPCCGVAVGFERLLMLACGADSLTDVLTFSPTDD